MTVAPHREHHEARGDHDIDCAERDHRQPHARARLGRAVDIAAVEQRTDQPAAPRLGRDVRRPNRLAPTHVRLHGQEIHSALQAVSPNDREAEGSCSRGKPLLHQIQGALETGVLLV